MCMCTCARVPRLMLPDSNANIYCQHVCASQPASQNRSEGGARACKAPRRRVRVANLSCWSGMTCCSASVDTRTFECAGILCVRACVTPHIPEPPPSRPVPNRSQPAVAVAVYAASRDVSKMKNDNGCDRERARARLHIKRHSIHASALFGGGRSGWKGEVF